MIHAQLLKYCEISRLLSPLKAEIVWNMFEWKDKKGGIVVTVACFGAKVSILYIYPGLCMEIPGYKYCIWQNNTLGVEADNEALILFESYEFTTWISDYVGIKSWKFHWDIY